jgi:predicted RNA-binding Zn-ribbon protein involved in translation (DUF1610 family)
MVRLTCPSCSRPLSVDEAKLPMREVNFPCPSCGAAVRFDRRSVEAESSDPHPPGLLPGEENGERAVVIGPESAPLREALQKSGFHPQFAADLAAARELLAREQTRLVVLAPGRLPPPPLQEMAPLLSMPPADRRRAFFVLTGEGVRTFDGNAAFLYGVDLVVAAKDLANFPAIYREADEQHRKLYQHLL